MTAPSLYERAMGDSYALLPAAVQRFHRLSGRVVLHGSVQTHAPASSLARVLAFCLGAPQRASSGPIRFELDASPVVERWTRCFPTQTMTSRLRLVAGSVEEQLGAARLTFQLLAADGRLEMALTRMRFLGVPCPRWLLPRITAEESGDDDRFHFRVCAALPWVGTVASYHGHLDIPRH